MIPCWRNAVRSQFFTFVALLALTSFVAAAGQADDLEYLERRAAELIAGCRMQGTNGVPLYTPDGKAHYAALWTRDFAYMVENAGDLMPTHDVEQCVQLILDHQRGDGAIPDRVQPNGVAVYCAGPASAPLGEANLDNPQFAVIAADHLLSRLDRKKAVVLFCNWAANLDRAMDWIPRAPSGLVYNDPANPHSPYGFTDCVGKTGELFMESLLYWTACQRLERWHRAAGCHQRAREYHGRAALIERNCGRLFSAQAGAFFAASQDCKQIDIWANAYAVHLKFPLKSRRKAVLEFLSSSYDRYVWRGQVRHLLEGDYWNRFLTPVEKDRYQNGAYWATASGWVMGALSQTRPDLARRMFGDLMADFRQNGICECVHHDYRQLDSYVVSATNPLAVARKIFR